MSLTLPPQNLIQRPEYSQRLAEALQIKERTTVPELEPSIQPVILVDDLTNAPDGKGETRRRYSASHAQGQVAGNYSWFFLVNPPTSTQVGAVRQLTVTTDAAPTAVMLENIVRVYIADWDNFPPAVPMQTAMPLNTRNTQMDGGTMSAWQFSSLRAQGTNQGAVPVNGILIGDYYSAQNREPIDLSGVILVPGATLIATTAQTANPRNIIGTVVWDETPVSR